MPAHVRQQGADLPFSQQHEGEESQLLDSYRSLIESIPGIVYTAELGATGRWLYVSPQIEAILGWSADEWCTDASIWFMQLHPEDRDRALADEYHSRTTGEPLTSEYRMLARDGSVIWFQDRASLVQDEYGEATFFHGVMLDITERKRTEADLTDNRARLAKAQAIAHMGSWEWDVPANRLAMSEELYRICGIAPGQFGETIEAALALTHPDDRSRAARFAALCQKDCNPFTFEMRIIRPDGEVRAVELHGEVDSNGSGGPARVLGTIHDITERQAVRDALRRSHDQFQSIIDNSPSVIHAKDRNFRYLFVNKAFAHMYQVDPNSMVGCADETVLSVDVAERNRESDCQVLTEGQVVNEEDIVQRAGGERTFLTQKFPLRDPQGNIYAVCAISTDITERRAREEELRAEMEWSIRVHEAVRRNQFVLYSQPILDLRAGGTDQEELLVRMRGPGGRHLPPADFLPPAERFGLVTEIDRWVIANAVEISSRRTGKVEVNISAKSIGDPGLVELIETELRRHGSNPANLIFEITETAAAENMEAARDFAWWLKGLGCGFALDDFGTGYGSFTYLKHLPVDFIKIDLEFVRYLSIDPSDQKIVKSIIAVAKNFGVRTIAEGVEQQATLDLLRSLEVDYAQGFLIGEPRPVV